MTLTQPTANQITSNMEQDTAACNQLIKLLETERKALAERDMDTLETTIKEKAEHLEQLENGAKQRFVWIQSGPSGQKDDLTEQWKALLQSTAPNQLDKWQNFHTLLKRCQNENDINGKLLARNQQVFSRIISILRGQGESQNTYGTKTGSKKNNPSGQYLGEA